VPRRKQRSCVLLAVILPLVAVALCGGISILVFAPKPADAIAELKWLDIYPSATAVSISDNSYSMTDGLGWSYKGGGGVIMTDYHRSLEVTLATMMFETGEAPDSVQAFYEREVTNRQYYEVEVTAPDRQYLRYEDPYPVLELVEDFPGLYRDRPLYFYQLTIRAVKVSAQSGTATALTRVTVEVQILREAGGLR
jgi:hypothetical protein